MTNTELAKLPNTGDLNEWTEAEKGLAAFVGMSVKIDGADVIAPRGVREAFLIAVDRTQLDPIARQIYLVYIGGKWLIIVSIDGFRLVAQRSKEYRGQDDPEWTSSDPADETWHDVWLADEAPGAARVRSYRKGFKKPMTGIATWKAYGKEGGGKRDGQWEKNGPHMLAIRAEAQSLRKAFPMELSGLYTIEEFDTDKDSMVAGDQRDWEAELNSEVIGTVADVDKLYNAMRDDAGWTPVLDAKFRAKRGSLAVKEQDAANTIVVNENEETINA